MEDITDPSFRFMCKQFGVDFMYTEFISSDGLIRKGAKSVSKLKIYDPERPVGIQLYGHIREAMVEAALITEQANPEVIDLNFGCPVKKIARRGAGAGMLQNVPLMIDITRSVVDAVKLPVSVKTRLGWDEENKIIVELAERLQDTGICAITIHGRTRAQFYGGEADWTLIGEVKNNQRMKIPVIGNGDVDSPAKAAQMFSRYGVDAIMIGRASIGMPWIFRDVRHYLDTGNLLPEPDIEEKAAWALMHLEYSLQHKGGKKAILELRRHLSHYFKGLPNFRDTRLRLLTSTDPEEIRELICFIADKWSGYKNEGRSEIFAST